MKAKNHFHHSCFTSRSKWFGLVGNGELTRVHVLVAASAVFNTCALHCSKTTVILQENEKLYLQMKAQQAKSKANEEAMFKENQRLLNELAFTRCVCESIIACACLSNMNVH